MKPDLLFGLNINPELDAAFAAAFWKKMPNPNPR